LLNKLWENLDRGGRIGVIAGAALIVGATAIGGYFVARTDYQVLFADMSMQDTAAMVAELDRLKVPYRLGEGGTTILVDKEAVHKTRLTLMGKDLPLHGAVGLELFNTTDFGMTEFAQKINYQRALQGELTRTILSLPEVRDARVHLAFPEQGLFKQPDVHPKAAVYLTLKNTEALRKDQVSGIQRLVAAAVPGVAMQDVTIVDQHGVALTRPAETNEAGEGGSSRLDIKRDLETYLSRKVGEVLDRAFGPGQAIASVDVSLDMNRVRLTEEKVLGAPGVSGNAAGTIVRERQVTQEAPAPLDAAAAAGRNGNAEHEVEYQLGRRVEQIVGQPGSIQQIQVIALVRKPLNAEQVEKLKRVVAAAAGTSAARGDTVEVQAIEEASTAVAEHGAVAPAANRSAAPSLPAQKAAADNLQIVAVLAGLLAIVTGGAGIAYLRRPKAHMAVLSHEERSAALQQIRLWLEEDKHKEAV
jgi:flagellar M-ring protein FliF